MLLRFLKWLKTNSDFSFHILLKDGGELEEEFADLAPVSFFHPPHLQPSGGLTAQLYPPLLKHLLTRVSLKLLKEQLTRKQFDLIYLNTVANAEVLGVLDMIKCPVICHVHELDCWIRYQTGSEHFNLIKHYATCYIAVSQAVKLNLIEQHNIPEEKIVVIPGVPQLKTSEFRTLEQIRNTRKRICTQLQIPEQAMIICGSGTTDWRKGPDLFVQLAQKIHARQKQASIYFLWVGGDNTRLQFGQLWHDVQHLGLGKYIRFLGSQIDPFSYFAASDVFVLTSREDPFPLVCLEAASLGKPIVCFDKAGGMPEFVEDDAGVVVPYLDLDTMAATVMNVLQSPEVRERLGRRARQKVRERHDIEQTAPRIVRTIERYRR